MDASTRCYMRGSVCVIVNHVISLSYQEWTTDLFVEKTIKYIYIYVYHVLLMLFRLLHCSKTEENSILELVRIRFLKRKEMGTEWLKLNRH